MVAYLSPAKNTIYRRKGKGGKWGEYSHSQNWSRIIILIISCSQDFLKSHAISVKNFFPGIWLKKNESNRERLGKTELKKKKPIILNLEKRAILDAVVQRVHNVTKTIFAWPPKMSWVVTQQSELIKIEMIIHRWRINELNKRKGKIHKRKNVILNLWDISMRIELKWKVSLSTERGKCWIFRLRCTWRGATPAEKFKYNLPLPKLNIIQLAWEFDRCLNLTLCSL